MGTANDKQEHKNMSITKMLMGFFFISLSLELLACFTLVQIRFWSV